MYKGSFSNTGTYDVYNIVKEAAAKATDISFNYDRRDYTIEYSGRQIAMNHYGKVLISNTNYSVMNSYIQSANFCLFVSNMVFLNCHSISYL